MAVAGGGALEGVAGHALDFENGILSQVAGFFLRYLVFAEVNVSGQLAHDFKIAVAEPLRTKRRDGAQRGAQANGTQIDVKAEFLANAEQASLGARAERKRLPLRPADGAEQDRVRPAASGQ